jgi:predicted dithiol-disulfide oxidoreductase (DUF899 family)
MALTFPGESPEYRAARNELLAEELELRRKMEAVAARRRALPKGGVVPVDYVFEGADAGGRIVPVRLAELFSPGITSLAVYSMMFPRDPRDRRAGAARGDTAQLPLEEAPCPSCTALIDQFEGAALHTAPRMDLVIVASAPIERLLTFAKERGWRRMRFLSSAKNGYSRDYHGEDENGFQLPMLNVFSREGDVVRHFWASELFDAPADPGQDPRHVGTIEPMWNLFDLTREGRAEGWEEQMEYSVAPSCHC